MRDVDIAWAVGLFEGEGCIGIWKTQKGRKLPLIRLSLEMTDRDVVERFCEVVACGRVTGPHVYKRPTNRKPTYGWLISNRADVERILLMFQPWLGERRSSKAQEVLAEIAKLNMQCEHCGKAFRSHRILSRFCSSRCRSQSYYLAHRPVGTTGIGRPRTL